jgi:hypothetical protein
VGGLKTGLQLARLFLGSAQESGSRCLSP